MNNVVLLNPQSLLLGSALFFFSGPISLAEPIDFARDIQPILNQRCIRCHGPKKQEGGLRLDMRRRVRQGGDTGPALGMKGELLRRITSTDETQRMPPGDAVLPPAQIAKLRAWIEQDAPWPDTLAGKESVDDHWAFRPVRRPAVPGVRGQESGVRNPIDRFVLARLEKEKFAPAPEAERRTLVRRLHLDLTGLPPAPVDVEAVLKDDAPDWYEKVVERLLASPHFGERWGRHWLDRARYAESDGYENDQLRPDAYRWRDWVVDAFNRDLPFDQFTIEQLAGDLLPEATVSQRVATGLHRNTLWNSAASADKEEFRTYAIKDRAETTAAVWMGLTLACANCHSHKYDPISQREYYQLYAFFNNTENAEVAVPGGKAPVLKSVVRPSHVHLRGSYLRKGPLVEPGTPAFLPQLQCVKPQAAATRLDLARWLVEPGHPLTARVAADNLWQHLFGAGLVPTPENFGTSGQLPVHAELLDWLAAEYVRLGWSRKAMIRTIVFSAAYRQASIQRDDDPKNLLMGRQNRFRVEAEIVRDLALSVSGLLDRRLGGPSIVPPFPRELPTGQFTAEALKMPTGERHRRGIYLHVQRTLTHPSLSAFDAADGNQHCLRRARSATPLAALTLLNDPTFDEAARALGARLRREGKDRDERLRLGFALCLSRLPADEERAIFAELIDRQEKHGAKEEMVWLGVARVLLNLEEFTTRE